MNMENFGHIRESILKNVLLGFVIGIFFRSLFRIGFYFFLFLLFLSFILLLYYFIKKRNAKTLEKEHEMRIILFASVFVLSLSLGILRFNLSEINKINSQLEGYIDKNIELKGIISDEPDERENKVNLIFSVEKLENMKLHSEKILIVSDLYPQYSYGDELTVTGKLIHPENFAGNSGKIFDYNSYLAKDGIYYEIIHPKIELVSSGHGNFIKSWLFSLKKLLIEKINVIPPPQSLLLGGLLIGAKHSLSTDLKNIFTKAGIVHIVVLSGYNITIVAESLMSFFSFLPMKYSFLVGAISIVLFAIMTGGSSTVIRASLMVLLVLLGKYWGRKYDIKRLLFIVGFLMILQNPKILVFDPSFQLSFLATLGLLYITPILEEYFKFITDKFGLRSIIVATFSTQVFVLPLLLYQMGNLSLVAPIVNLLILPFIPVTMFFGFITGVLGFINYYLALPFAFISNILLTYEIKTAEIFAELPFSVIQIKNFGSGLLVLSYVIIFLVTYLRKK